jgi:hypothetical protein
MRMKTGAPISEFTLIKSLSVIGTLVQLLFSILGIDLCKFQACNRVWKSCSIQIDYIGSPWAYAAMGSNSPL